MRKITSNAIASFNNDFTFNQGNTVVKVAFGRHPLLGDYKGTLTILSLHGNDIAIKTHEGLYITNAGWQSNTTKERLNALPGVSIQQKDYTWYLNGKEWDGKLIKIS